MSGSSNRFYWGPIKNYLLRHKNDKLFVLWSRIIAICMCKVLLPFKEKPEIRFESWNTVCIVNVCPPLLLGVFVCLRVLQITSNTYIFHNSYLEILDFTVDPTDLNVCVFTGSTMWFCHHPHGSVLVHRVYASSCDCLVAGCPLPDDGHHGSWTGMINMYFYSSDVTTLLSGFFWFMWLLLYPGRRTFWSLFFLYYVAPFWPIHKVFDSSLMPSTYRFING